MLCGLGVPLLRSLWGAVQNRQLYILRMYCKGWISFDFSIFFIIYTIYRKKKLHAFTAKKITRLDDLFLHVLHFSLLSLSGAFAGWPRWHYWCIVVYFRFLASKALHCTLYRAEHFIFSYFQSWIRQKDKVPRDGTKVLCMDYSMKEQAGHHDQEDVLGFGQEMGQCIRH